MSFLDGIYYGCGLRAKQGELAALAMLRHDAADHTLPRLIIAPAKEANKAQLSLLSDTGRLNLLPDLQQSWRGRPVIIDPSYVLNQFGRDDLARWFAPAIVEAAEAGSSVIPCMRFDDLADDVMFGFRTSTDAASGYFGIALRLLHATDPIVLAGLVSELRRHGFDIEKGIVVADFVEDDFSDAELAAPILENAFETILASAPWFKVIFQASSYPEANPAAQNSAVTVRRGDLLTFQQVVEARSDFPRSRVLFGDYGADSGRIDFNVKNRRAYPHLRYNLGDSWMVVRGANKGDFASALKTIATHIIGETGYSGPGFSEADFRIRQIAGGLIGPGGPSEWRSLNMCRHITKVVSDFGGIFGYALEQRSVSDMPRQEGLGL